MGSPLTYSASYDYGISSEFSLVPVITTTTVGGLCLGALSPVVGVVGLSVYANALTRHCRRSLRLVSGEQSLRVVSGCVTTSGVALVMQDQINTFARVGYGVHSNSQQYQREQTLTSPNTEPTRNLRTSSGFGDLPPA